MRHTNLDRNHPLDTARGILAGLALSAGLWGVMIGVWVVGKLLF